MATEEITVWVEIIGWTATKFDDGVFLGPYIPTDEDKEAADWMIC